MIQVSNLIYDYPGTRTLDDVSFTIRAGSITALVGPNGASKTTLLRCLAALEEPVSGRIAMDGRDILDDPRSGKPASVPGSRCKKGSRSGWGTPRWHASIAT